MTTRITSRTSHERLQLLLLDERRRADHRAATLYAVTRALAESISLREGLFRVIDVLCEFQEWSCGVLWSPDPKTGVLRLDSFRSHGSERFPEFQALCRRMTFPRGLSLPGLAWETRQPVWCRDVLRERNFPVASAAELDGLRAALAFPVVQGPEVFGVFELFKPELRTIDDDLLETFRSIGCQAGLFVERMRAVESLREQYRLAQFTAEVSLALTRDNSLEGMLQECANSMVAQLQAVLARIWILDPAGNVLRLRASSGLDIRQDESVVRLQKDQSRIAQIAVECAPHFTNDMRDDPLLVACDGAARDKLVGFAGHPLIVDGRAVGVMAMISRDPVSYSRLDALASVASHIASAIQRKQAESALRDAQEQLLQSQRLEAIGTLAGAVAHEFNNLLQIILGHLPFVIDSIDEGNPALEDLRRIERTAERARALTRQLLSFGRRQSLKRVEVNVDQAVEELASMLQPLLKSSIQFEIEPADRPPVIHADSGQLHQILLNLCINARDAMPQGGRLALRTEVRTLAESPSIAWNDFRPGEYVCISVEDTGTGIDPAHRAHIFEPFFTTKEVGKGTGLGLSTVYGLVRQHEGFISVQSELQRGSTFRIYFPSAASRRPPAELPSHDGESWQADDEVAGREMIPTSEDLP